jgi:hypothetical protein
MGPDDREAPVPTQEEFDDLTRRLSGLKAERDVLAAHSDALEAQINSITSDRNTLYQRLLNKMGSGTRPIAPPMPSAPGVQSEQVAALRKELDEARKRLSSRDEKLAKLDAMEAERLRNVAAMTRLGKDLTSAHRRLENERTDAGRARAQLEGQLREAASRADAAESEVAALRASGTAGSEQAEQIRKLNAELSATRLRALSTSTRIKRLEQALGEAQERVAALGGDTEGDEAVAQLRAEQTKMEALEASHTDLKTLVREQRRQIREFEEAVAVSPKHGDATELRATLEELLEGLDERVRAAYETGNYPPVPPASSWSDPKRLGVMVAIAAVVLIPLTALTTAMVLRGGDSGREAVASSASVASDPAAAADEAPGDERTEDAGADGEAATGPAPTEAGPPAEQLLEIDRLIATGDDEAAMARIGPITDAFPGNGAVQWRYGQVQALLGKRKRNSRIRSQALVAYEHALDADPALLENGQFFAELDALLTDKRLRTQALDILLHKLGPAGHKTLLTFVNTPGLVGYVDRHRALTALRGSQASGSTDPCGVFSQTLQGIEAAPKAEYVDILDRARLPSGDEPRCEALPAWLDRVRHQHYFHFGTPDDWSGAAVRRWKRDHKTPPPALPEPGTATPVPADAPALPSTAATPPPEPAAQPAAAPPAEPREGKRTRPPKKKKRP